MNILLALLAAVALFGAGAFVYRRRYIRSRAALVAIGIVIGLLIVWGMTPGVAPSS
ncbi:MAG TPA: hypothetical protein VF757_10070 [Sphingomicrobium sp.]